MLFILLTLTTISLMKGFHGSWVRKKYDPLLNELPMLMSHDSASGYLPSDYTLTARIGKTQTGNVTEQLNCGVRAFDLRPYCSPDGIVYMHHGIFVIRETLENFLNEVIVWANNHPAELVVISSSHYGPNSTCKEAVWNIMTNLNLMPSIGGPSGSCSKLDGLRVSEAKKMAKLEGGGHIFIVEGEGTCVDGNWVQSLTCYRDNGDCRIGSNNSQAINEELFDYVKSTASHKPKPDRLFTIQAHWQYNVKTAIQMISANSSVLKDSLGSKVNKNVLCLIPKLKYINFFQVDNACYYGTQLYDALTRKSMCA